MCNTNGVYFSDWCGAHESEFSVHRVHRFRVDAVLQLLDNGAYVPYQRGF